ncbi:MAG: FadR/GntR family transcriptional regulator, partial [Anaerolineales bacterium]
MGLEPVPHRTLAESVAGQLAAKVLDGTFKPGDQLPPERELISQLEVSRATLR